MSPPQNFLVGVFWIMGVCLVSAVNDVLFKKLGAHLQGINVLFFRFLGSALSLLPFILNQPKALRCIHWKTHALRGFLFALAMIPWSYGLIDLPLPLMTTISFTTPIFVTLLAAIWLKEKVGWQRLVATLLGFIGILASTGFSFTGMDPMLGVALLATFLFAVLDIVNKTLLKAQESILSMMFFSSCWTTFFVFPLSLFQWQWPALQDLGFLFALGLGANALLGCLLKASASYDLSALQPFRYTEFLISCLFSFVLFHEAPTAHVFWGMALILPSTLYLSVYEMRKKKA